MHSKNEQQHYVNDMLNEIQLNKMLQSYHAKTFYRKR